MIEAETGDLLENCWPSAGKVYATRIIDPCMAPPLIRGRNSGGTCCPICKEEAVIHVLSDGCPYHRYATEDRGFKCHVFYCVDCWLAWENEVIGELDKDGEFHSLDDPDYWIWKKSTVPVMKTDFIGLHDEHL